MKSQQVPGWPRVVREGRVRVRVYRRKNGNGIGFRVASYADGKRQLLSFASEEEALSEARRIARRLSEGDAIGASIRGEDAAAFAAANQCLAPHGVSLVAGAEVLAEALRLCGSLAGVLEASKAWATDRKSLTRVRIADLVEQYIDHKQRRGSSRRHVEDLRCRLNRFATAAKKDACDVTVSDVQAYLDSLDLSPQSVKNSRTVLNGLFEFALARGLAAKNVVGGTESVSVRATGDVAIYSPEEFRLLLEASDAAFQPILALGGLAGLRSSELERVEWSDVDLVAGHVALGAARTKTATRRLVPLCAAAIAWLKPHAKASGRIWADPGRDSLYRAQKEASLASGVSWQQNGLRHSYGTYRFALTGDAGRVARELGNSAAIVHTHYRALATPEAAREWFGIIPR